MIPWWNGARFRPFPLRKRGDFNPAAVTSDYYPGDGVKISVESHFELPVRAARVSFRGGIASSIVQENIKKKNCIFKFPQW